MKKYIYILFVLVGCSTTATDKNDFEKKIDKLEYIKSLYHDSPNFQKVWFLSPDSLISSFTNAYYQNQDSANNMFYYYDSLYSLANRALLRLDIEDRKVKNQSQHTGKPLSSESYIIAQSAIKQRLKSPTTAKFPRGKDYTYTFIASNQHRITSYVDSQNSFGAMMRTNYTILLEFKGGDWSDIHNWKVISVDFF